MCITCTIKSQVVARAQNHVNQGILKTNGMTETLFEVYHVDLLNHNLRA